MNFLYTDKNGNKCAAKFVFMMFCLVFMAKILMSGMKIYGVEFEVADYTGMASFLTVLAGIYGWRATTKAAK